MSEQTGDWNLDSIEVGVHYRNGVTSYPLHETQMLMLGREPYPIRGSVLELADDSDRVVWVQILDRADLPTDIRTRLGCGSFVY